MAAPSFAVLDARGVLEIAGDDRQTFLQGLVSNDVTRVSETQALHAAFLTAQGKYLFDFAMVALGSSICLDAEAARIGDLQRRLGIYKLRSAVTIADAGARFEIAVGMGPGAAAAAGLPETPGAARTFAGGVAFVDPRLAALGVRFLLPRGTAATALPAAGFAPATADDYDRLRLGLGIPDGSRDLIVDKAILLESGFDELHGIDWQKGCYMGQELTARTKYRGLVKKRLLPVRIEGTLPAPGTLVMQGAEEVGEIRSGRDGLALALLRLNAIDTAAPLTAGEARLTVSVPDWARLPENAG